MPDKELTESDKLDRDIREKVVAIRKILQEMNKDYERTLEILRERKKKREAANA